MAIVNKAAAAAGFLLLFFWALQVASAPLTPDGTVLEPVSSILDMRAGKAFQEYEIANGTVRSGQTLAALLSPYSIADELVYRAVSGSRDIFDVRQIKAGHTYSVVFDPALGNRARYLIYDQTPETYVFFDFYGPVKIRVGRKNVTVLPRVIHGNITGSLWTSLESRAHHAELIRQLADIFSGTMDLNRLGKNDTFKLLYNEKYVDGRSIGIERIQSAILTVGGTRYQAFYFEAEDICGFFDENGNSLEKSFLKTPLEYTRVSSSYKPRRLHPVTKEYRPHPGIDYAAPTGTPVKAVSDGTVIFKGYSSSAGNYIKIQHLKNQVSEYLHLSKFANGLKKNMPVRKGDVIGYVGQTGLATGPHLDFRFMRNGKYLNYAKLTFPSATPLNSEQKALFDRQVAGMFRLLQLAGATPARDDKRSNVSL